MVEKWPFRGRLAWRKSVFGHDGGAEGKDNGLDLLPAPVAGFLVGVEEEVEAVAAPDLASAILDHAIAIARDVDDGAHVVVARIGGERAGLDPCPAGRDAHRLELAAIVSFGNYGAAEPVALPTATVAAMTVAGHLDLDDPSVDQTITAFLPAEEEYGAPAQDERGEDRQGKDEHLAAHIVGEASPIIARMTIRFIWRARFGKMLP